MYKADQGAGACAMMVVFLTPLVVGFGAASDHASCSKIFLPSHRNHSSASVLLERGDCSHRTWVAGHAF